LQLKEQYKVSISNKNEIKPHKNKSAVADWLQAQQHHVWAGCGCGHGYGYFVYNCVHHFQNRKIMRIQVCVNVPFLKLENNAKKWVLVWVWMWVWVLLCWCGWLKSSHLSKSGEKLLTLGMR
jgi:hypothetical protein